MAKSNGRRTNDPHVVVLYQQGDVLIVEASIPLEARRAIHSILARGEATGHAHRLADATDGLLYEGPDGTLYLRVGAGGATITHEEHRPLTLPLGEYRVGRVREYDHFSEEARIVRD